MLLALHHLQVHPLEVPQRMSLRGSPTRPCIVAQQERNHHTVYQSSEERVSVAILPVNPCWEVNVVNDGKIN